MAEVDRPPQMRWWGWGDEAHPVVLPPHAIGFLTEAIGALPRPRPPVAIENVVLGPSRLPQELAERLSVVVGAEAVRVDHRERVLHAAGKGYPDLVRLRAGRPDGAPDAILYPADHQQVRAVLDLCARASIAVVPFGGGTSVVGGVSPMAGEHEAVIALDLARMRALHGLDRESSTVLVGAGLRAPELERLLAPEGLTLGHFPQSFEYVSLGGCAATRSAGQASTGYGAIEKMVLGLRFAAPASDIALAALPATAAGPSLRQMLVGSEGALGVITELSLRVRPAPRERTYEGVFFETFAAGVTALRTLSLEHVLPDVARLSDERETAMSLTLAGASRIKDRLGRAYLGLRGYGQGCVAILGFEGTPEDVAHRRGRALELVRAQGGLAVGRSPGEAWLRGRFSGPYLRDDLLSLGVMVETLETATQFSNVGRLHQQVEDAIAAALQTRGTPGLVMCHVSHVYETGASLYFTFIARQSEDDELGQWQAVKDAACEAILDGGGTITHHHAVGHDHARWMPREVGVGGVQTLRALKAELDPAGIMNPGKLLALSRP
ncbi:MAG TPA: FAD-binding oxidoreductase [Solirubrobacteraceae bacterium]